jgi:hypothetical protein
MMPVKPPCHRAWACRSKYPHPTSRQRFWRSRDETGRAGLPYIFGPHVHLTIWWLATWGWPACLAAHYWRQVRADIAPAIPGFIAAERAAFALAIVPVIGLLAAPFIWLGAPWLGAVALSAVGAVGGNAAGGNAKGTGVGGSTRALRLVLLMPFLCFGFIPHALSTIVFAPWPAALLILATAIGLIVTGTAYRPAMAATQEGAADAQVDALPMATPRRGGVLHAVLTWQPRILGSNPLPAAFGVRLGTAGLLLAGIAQMAVFLLVVPGCMALVTHAGFTKVLHAVAAPEIGTALAVTSFMGGQWLLRRGDWPLLFCAGHYGARAAFSRGLFVAHGQNQLQISLINAVLATAIACGLGVVPQSQAWLLMPALFALLFGAGYAVALPLTWHEFGGRGINMVFGFIAYLAVLTIVEVCLLAPHGLFILGVLVSCGIGAGGMVIAAIAPRRLAQMDWPIEDA